MHLSLIIMNLNASSNRLSSSTKAIWLPPSHWSAETKDTQSLPFRSSLWQSDHTFLLLIHPTRLLDALLQLSSLPPHLPPLSLWLFLTWAITEAHWLFLKETGPSQASSCTATSVGSFKSPSYSHFYSLTLTGTGSQPGWGGDWYPQPSFSRPTGSESLEVGSGTLTSQTSYHIQLSGLACAHCFILLPAVPILPPPPCRHATLRISSPPPLPPIWPEGLIPWFCKYCLKNPDLIHSLHLHHPHSDTHPGHPGSPSLN